MAGGKETPRQKMIGMMYLVLTALLALQVSSAVLEKFAIINVTLEELVAEDNKKNAAILAAIRESAQGKTNPKVVTALANAEKVREATANAMQEIEKLKGEMMKVSGTDKVDGVFINNHGSQVATMMIDPRNTRGKAFEKMLNDYVTTLNQLTGEQYNKIAKAPKDIDFFKDDPDHNKKDFLTFTFENTPPIAALTTISQFQTEMMATEALALGKLAVDAEAGVVKFDKIVPMVKPKSSIVAAGAKYEADMFITASAEGLTPEMFMDGKKLDVQLDPSYGVMMGKVSFPASAGAYDATGLARKTFEAEIRIGDSEDQIYKQSIEYFVAKPVIRVTTGNAPTLYMNCGNLVNIEVPALGTDYNPSFSARGGSVIKGDKPGRVTLVPKERKMAVTVANGGATLGTENFDVKPIPSPKYVAMDNNRRPIDMKNGVRGASLTGLRISAEAEENFKQEVPQDANYRIRSMEVILARGTQRVATINANSEILDMGAWRSQFRPGDRIIVDIKTVTRRTFQGEDERVAIRSEVLNIPIQ
ncbi:MAG: gliding motility protein GldM [Cyclobacteriaceae bacterium]|nr:gliding motility protein GldM [Cyclobacteriaceae bacterium]